MVFAPTLSMNRSTPSPPTRMSLPAPPLSVFLPETPLSESSPAPPVMRLAFVLPKIVVPLLPAVSVRAEESVATTLVMASGAVNDLSALKSEIDAPSTIPNLLYMFDEISAPLSSTSLIVVPSAAEVTDAPPTTVTLPMSATVKMTFVPLIVVVTSLAPPVTWITSFSPLKFCTTRLPSLKTSVSLPAPALTVSLPLPPSISLPPLPATM